MRPRPGSVSGRIYAVSTLGSFIGTFLPGLLLIPTIGTYRTFLAISGLMLLVALVLLVAHLRLASGAALAWMPLVIAGLAVVGVQRLRQSHQRADLRDRIVLQLHPGAAGWRLPLSAPERGPGRALDLPPHPTALRRAVGTGPGGALFQPPRRTTRPT